MIPALGPRKNPDVQEFQWSVWVSFGFAVAAFIFAFVTWQLLGNDSQEVVFGAPIYPILGCASEYEGDGQWKHLEPDEAKTHCEEMLQEDIASGKYSDDEAQLMPAQLAKSLDVIADYWDVEQSEKNARPSATKSPSIFEFVQFCLLAIGLTVPFFFYSKQLEVDHILKQWQNANSTQQRLEIMAIRVIVAFVIGYLLWYSADVAWLFVNRIGARFISFEVSTALGITTLIVGLLAYLVTRFSIGIRPTSLSGLAIFILLAGLIVGMLVTNVAWSRGLSPAFSNMSSHADPYILTLAIDGDLGSRMIFRHTFTALGILMIVFSIEMRTLLTGMIGQSVGAQKLNPKRILGVGILAGILMMLVGVFPSRDGLCPDESFMLRVLQQSDCMSEGWSGFLHGIGATLGVAVLWLLMFIYPVWGYPRPSGDENSSESSYAKWVYLLGVSLAVVVLSIMVPYVLFLTIPDQSWWLRAIASFFILLVAVEIIRRILSTIYPEYPLDPSMGKQIGIVLIGLGIVALISFYMTSDGDQVRLVTVEYVILMAFSIFLYSYAMYTREYLDDLAAANLGS